jgi:aryl-phospho-beta-D-glucosidase BglC (GH1 family)
MKKYFYKLILTFSLILCIFHVEAMTTSGEDIFNTEGEIVELKGVNWFGFNTNLSMVEGLENESSLAADFATVVYRLQLLGFNAVRLSFSFKDLYELEPQIYLKQYTVPSLTMIQESVTNPAYPVAEGKIIPPMHAPPLYPSVCNDYLPNTSTFDRFVWVVNFFAENGFYVLIDNHLREDQLVLNDKEKWIKCWKELVTALSAQPAAKDRLMIDILNEPDNFKIRWEQLQDLYLSAMDALYPINERALFFIEGTGQGGIGANWGDGFATDPKVIAEYELSDPNPFFRELLNKPYLNQVVISPHVYPPSVTRQDKGFTGHELAHRLSTSFGALGQNFGYCDGMNSHVFPIAIGEFGSNLADQKDIDCLNDLVDYFNHTGVLADGKHPLIKSWFFWSWNPTSRNTKGVVEANWVDIVWKKIDYLTKIGLRPWYLDLENNDSKASSVLAD